MADQYNDDARNVDNIVSDFSATSQELLANIDGVTEAIEEVSRATVEGAEHTTEMSEKVQEILQEAQNISQMMERTDEAAKKLGRDVSVFVV